MKKVKFSKIAALLLVVSLIFTVMCASGCTSASESEPKIKEVNTNKTETLSVEVVSGETIGSDCTYTLADGSKLTFGDKIPLSPSKGDTYETGEYKYTYNRGGDYGTEWSVKAIDDSKEVYGKILSKIAGKPVTSMHYTFNDCASLTDSPTIPDIITDISCAFAGCKSLIVPPDIPDGIENMRWAFWNCTSLATAPVVPDSVKDVSHSFDSCTSLSSSIEVNANPVSYAYCLKNTKVSKITGSCSQETKDALLATK